MFAVFLFVLLPLMSLILHLGMTTLARRQMQSGVNSASLEGLRHRDNDDLSEIERREQVQDLMTAIYDDNLSSDAEDELQFGAGTVVNFDVEASDIQLPGTNFKASRTIRSENIGVYDPILELNTGNEQHGDQLRGNYIAGMNHSEESNYARTDFSADPNGNSYLVRLRRTDGGNPLDSFAGVSSHGPTIPFLFGRGPYGDTDFLNRRERGTIVRSTAIAQAQPAMTVGWFDATVGEGLGQVVVTYSEWIGLTQPIPIADSHFVLQTADPLSIGEPRPPIGTTAEIISEYRFLAIVDDTTGRVIGFGAGTIDFDATLNAGTVEKAPSAVADSNASASILNPPNGLSTAGWEAVLTEHRIFKPDSEYFNPASEPLLAPALMRSYQ